MSTSTPVETANVSQNNSPVTLLVLESSWWGNEAFREWSEVFHALIVAETDDAVGVSMWTARREFDGDARRMNTVRGDDLAWVPKSSIEHRLEPDVEFAVDPVDEEGVLRLTVTEPTQYGRKRVITGDTYDLLAGDDAPVDPEWESTHLTFNGDEWAIDATPEAYHELAQACDEANVRLEIAG